MKDLKPYALGAAFVVLADRIIDVQLLTIPALLIALFFLISEGIKYGRRLYS